MVKISNLLRLGSSKQKTLQGSGNGKNFFCSSFQVFFQDYLAAANQHSNSIKGWYTHAYKFLSQNLECNFQDLQQFLSDADGNNHYACCHNLRLIRLYASSSYLKYIFIIYIIFMKLLQGSPLDHPYTASCLSCYRAAIRWSSGSKTPSTAKTLIET